MTEDSKLNADTYLSELLKTIKFGDDKNSVAERFPDKVCSDELQFKRTRKNDGSKEVYFPLYLIKKAEAGEYDPFEEK